MHANILRFAYGGCRMEKNAQQKRERSNNFAPFHQIWGRQAVIAIHGCHVQTSAAFSTRSIQNYRTRQLNIQMHGNSESAAWKELALFSEKKSAMFAWSLR